MSDIKRFYAGELPSNEYVIRAKDHDAAKSELSALREELAASQSIVRAQRASLDNCVLRHEAAEQRNAELEQMLSGALPAVKYEANRGDNVGAEYQVLADQIESTLKPTESGASA